MSKKGYTDAASLSKEISIVLFSHYFLRSINHVQFFEYFFFLKE